MLPPPPRSTLFPYTTLFRSSAASAASTAAGCRLPRQPVSVAAQRRRVAFKGTRAKPSAGHSAGGNRLADRKSTRLNSSHRCISYAVFCLKKKKTEEDGYAVE